jgi:hypothetical protein
MQKILSIDEDIVNTIIKPKQLSILKKILSCQNLTENEKRYLRGNLRRKLVFLEQLWEKNQDLSEHQKLLQIIDKYYITGLEALRYNGFGWYYEPKLIEIINTSLEGKIRLGTITLRFYRIKSIKKSKFIIDEQTGLKYAINEQIVKDIKYTKNMYTKVVWANMLNRYGKQFVKVPNKYSIYHPEEEVIDDSIFGV